MKPKPFFLVVVLLSLIASLLYMILDKVPDGKYYNCDIAEWHPDVPPPVKEACRRIRKEQIRGESI